MQSLAKLKTNLRNSIFKNNNIEKGIINIGEVISGIVEVLLIQSWLDEQDEKDRKSVSLWGINQKFPHKTEEYYKSISNIRKSNHSEKFKLSNVLNVKRNYNIITIDKNWYSWMNPNSIMLNAFKMAWLSYFPSEVRFKTQNYKRLELHEIKIFLIKNLKNHLISLYPWNDPTWSSQKYTGVDNNKELQVIIDEKMSDLNYEHEKFDFNNLSTQREIWNNDSRNESKWDISKNSTNVIMNELNNDKEIKRIFKNMDKEIKRIFKNNKNS